MRFMLIAVLTLLSVACAKQEVLSERVRVIFDSPDLAPYALQVAADAEQALNVLGPIFGLPAAPISILIEDNTDVYNAFALPLPRPQVRIRTLFPNDGFIGFGAESDLYLLLIHELTHSTQLAYTGSEPGLSLGLVGQDIASVAPGWFVEGIATWMESEYSTGGRRDDAVTNGLIASLALSDTWPSLTEFSLDTFSAWPGGLGRYLLGVRFIDYLVAQHGFDTILATLSQYNSGLLPQSFAGAWQKAVGTSLFDEWDGFQLAEVARASARASRSNTLLTDSGWYTDAPTFSPDGSRLAWVSWPPALVVADWPQTVAAGDIPETTTLLADVSINSLDWLDDSTLVFSRAVRQPGHTYNELFTLDITTQSVRQLTVGARAQFPRATPEGCVLFVRDLEPEGSSLQKHCEQQTELFWQAPAGTHIVGLTVSAGGRVALSLWQAGSVRLYLLEADKLTTLTGATGEAKTQDLAPAWQHEDSLIFRSNRPGEVFELYTVTVPLQGENTLQTQLTSGSLGGVFAPAPHPSEGVAYLALGEGGYNLAWLDTAYTSLSSSHNSASGSGIPLLGTAVLNKPAKTFKVQPYSALASLEPYGWLPSNVAGSLSPLGVGLGASLYGQDDSGDHSYSVTAGYDTRLTGYVAGVFANILYGYQQSVGVLPGEAYPWGVTVRTGLWQHTGHLDARTEIVAGLEFGVQSRLPLDRWTVYIGARAGLLALPSYGLQPEASVSFVLSQRRLDAWGYTTRGPRWGLSGVLSATPAGSSLGSWADASYYLPLHPFGITGTGELALRAGYRQAPQIPLALEPFAVVGTAGYRYSLPLELRHGDGLFALERLTLEPRLRGWVDGSVGIGGDLSVNLDTVLNYRAPLAFGVTVGYAQTFWYRFGVRLSL